MTMPGDPWRGRWIVRWILLLPLVVLVLWSCERAEDPRKTNPFEPGNLPDFNLVAALSAGHDTVSLSWDAVAGRGVRGYRLFRYEMSAEKVTEDALTDVPDTVLTYEDFTVIGGTIYLYKVAALDAEGRTSDVEGQVGVEVQVRGFVLIEPGGFTMGSLVDERGRYAWEGPQHLVELTQGFYMSQYEVTEQWWHQVMGGTPTNPQLPKRWVSWDMAVLFCNELSLQEGLTPAYTIHGSNGDVTWHQGANGYRLPTEAEWEYACRAGSTMAFANGPLTGSIYCTPVCVNLDAMGWCCGNRTFEEGPAEVGQKQANEWGLYDMHGNVWEWVWCGRRSYTSFPQEDPVHNVVPGADRVVRGGSWLNIARDCRSASRLDVNPDVESVSGGFRPVRSAN